jgi:hypothetical protein
MDAWRCAITGEDHRERRELRENERLDSTEDSLSLRELGEGVLSCLERLCLRLLFLDLRLCLLPERDDEELLVDEDEERERRLERKRDGHIYSNWVCQFLFML